MKETTKTVTVQQVAERFSVSLRRVHRWMQEGRVIPGIDSYVKLNPEFRNSPYVITANVDFLNKRKKLDRPAVIEDEADYLK